MQTFLPYPEFKQSASVLDQRRLAKQRIEIIQILNALLGHSKGWTNHPATKMWTGHEGSLATYGFAVCQEWISRGYKDTCMHKISDLIEENYLIFSNSFDDPWWLGDPAFHASHRAALLYKDPLHYSKFGWIESPAVPNIKGSLPYVWPTKESK